MRPFRFGPLLQDKGVTFRLWAPAAQSVELVTEAAARPMQPRDDGWYDLRIDGAAPGLRYRFRIDGHLDVPDPASAFQPDDVHGLSQVVAHNYVWQEENWRGRPWHEAVILELHVGSYTPAGTYRGVLEKLDHIVAAGFTAIELMPLADFPGRWNWGYDGVLLYAPDSSYGTPDDLKALIDTAHARGLMVFLDVVYNHFGPDGNYLHAYAPSFFTTDAHTPWGAAIDYRVPEVRAFAIENALHWLAHYRFDGLRLDAVHAIAARGTPSILEELSLAIGEFAGETNRQIHLILENDDNTAALLDPRTQPPRGRYQAQWNDDYHHAWHVMLTGETQGYYRDYNADTHTHLARVLRSGFAYQGEPSPHRDHAPRGQSTRLLPATAFVSFLQNHDQIGNRARGERLDLLADPRAIEAALAVTLISPMPPLMFMGEEWGSTQPFPFFCDFCGDLAEAVRQGRRTEFSEAYTQQDEDGEVPDPLAEATFRSAVLDWSAISSEPHQARLDLVRRLLEVRRQEILPRLQHVGPRQDDAAWKGDLLLAEFRLNGETLLLIANLCARPNAKPSGPLAKRMIWGGVPRNLLPPWSVYWGWR